MKGTGMIGGGEERLAEVKVDSLKLTDRGN